MEIYRIKSTYTAWAVGRPQRGNVHRAFIIFILIFIYNFPAVGSANPPSGVWVSLFLFFVFILFCFLGEGGNLENFQESICLDLHQIQSGPIRWTLPYLVLRILPKVRNKWFRGVFESSRTSTMELFCENSYRLKAVNYFRNKDPS